MSLRQFALIRSKYLIDLIKKKEVDFYRKSFVKVKVLQNLKSFFFLKKHHLSKYADNKL